ncbi:MAG: hypothetical protein WCL70_01465 [Paludibacter sp.]
MENKIVLTPELREEAKKLVLASMRIQKLRLKYSQNQNQQKPLTK